jgi:GDP-L-fucose synthase
MSFVRSLNPSWWKGKRVLVTGADGFVGQRVISWLIDWELVPSGHIRRFSLPDGDLRSSSDARWALAGCDVVLHLAADVGGLAYNSAHSADQFYNCSAIDLAVIEAARHRATARTIFMSCSSAYPADAPCPLKEESLFDGLPRDNHLGYGLAKRNGIVLASLYARQHGMSASAIISTNVYGPNDHFDETSHVVAAIIGKCCSAAREVEVWGDGSATRDFVFVDDAVMGVLLAAEHLAPGRHVNVGSGVETSIAALVETIVSLTGFGGKVTFDADKSAGEPRRSLDIGRAAREIGYVPDVGLNDGLQRTIDWYRSARGRPAPP